MPTVDQAASRRLFLKFLAASPLLAASDLAAFANEAPSRLPDPMMWAPRNLDKLIIDAEGSHQRLRLRAGDAQERAAGAFRLYGLRHR